MRIIAGEAKGRVLYAPPGETTRPTSDKIRGALFNILCTHTPGSRVLDLFGGTGALALEAVSRGAEFAVIVDADRAAIKAIERNAATVAGAGFAEKVKILRADYKAAVTSLRGESFDLIFIDPPYRMSDTYADSLLRLRAAGAVAPGAVFVLERNKAVSIQLPEGFECYNTRLYGDTAIDFVRERTYAQ